MSSKDIHKRITDHHKLVRTLYEEASELESTVIDSNMEALNSDIFTKNFEGRTAEEYTDFEKEVLKLIGSMTKAIVDSSISESYKNVLVSYKDVLEHLGKD